MSLEMLQLIWFGLIAVLWIGYLALEGFDFGVGMLLPILGKNNKERRVLINTIGPFWDGNEVWLLTAGGATFAAFPRWYAELFSAFYLPLLLVLVGLIIRGVAFEYRGKIDDDAWRARWDKAIIIGSWLPSVLWGVAFSAMLQGVNESARTKGPIWVLIDAITPYALLGGLVTVTLFMAHGALFLGMKTTDDLQARAMGLARKLVPLATVLAGVWALWTQLSYGVAWGWAPLGVAVAGLLWANLNAAKNREGQAFIGTFVTTIAAVVLIFSALYPEVLPIHGGESITVQNGSSTQHTLFVMLVIALIMTPIVLAYQTWTYWVFRARVGLGDIPAWAGLSKQAPDQAAPNPDQAAPAQ